MLTLLPITDYNKERSVIQSQKLTKSQLKIKLKVVQEKFSKPVRTSKEFINNLKSGQSYFSVSFPQLRPQKLKALNNILL